MFNLTEIMEKTKKQREEIEFNMDQTHGGFHPSEASIYDGLNDADRLGIKETLKAIPLETMIALSAKERNYLKYDLKEYVGHSGSLTTGFTGAGAAGFSYLLPDAVYTGLLENASMTDLAPTISNVVNSPGAYLKIDAEVDGNYKPKWFASGGEMAQETIKVTQGAITPRLFGFNIGITNEMLEDNAFDTMATHIRVAAKRMGEWSTLMTLFPVMDDHRASATTYAIEGAYNTVANAGDYCYISDLLEAEGQNAMDGFVGNNVVVAPPHIMSYLGVGESNKTWWMAQDQLGLNLNQNPIVNVAGMPVYRTTHMTTADTPAALQYWSGLYSTTWHELVLDKTYGIQTLRKRWLKMENYSDPVKDLVGAVVTSRQGHLVAYADACCVCSHA
jgi:hypothetical protein